MLYFNNSTLQEDIFEMKKMTLNSAKKNNETSISNIFLDNYMKDANGEFVKVYLYLLRCMGDSSQSLSLCDIADKLNHTEKDVIRALKYWNSHDVLSVTFDKETGEPSSITVLPLENTGFGSFDRAKEKVSADSASDNGGHGVSHSGSFSRSELTEFKEREDIKQLLYIVEKYIGKQLSSTDVRTLLYIRESLGLSCELIEYLVEYCVSNHHTSLRYMEKVAIAWSEQGISTVEDAKNASCVYGSRTFSVMKAFGISDRNLTPAELDFISRWYDEYGFDKEMIVEACKRTVLSMGKPNFSYTDGILRKWKSAGVHSAAELKVLDAGFRAKITVPVVSKPAASEHTNKFNNFSQRTYNFDEIEKNLINNDK